MRLTAPHPQSVRRDPVFPTAPLAPQALRSRVVVITGATDGVGLALAHRTVQAGAEVVLVGRNRAKTEHAATTIRSAHGTRAVHVEIADLLYVEEQHALAERIARRHAAIFALVNCAGALFLDREETREGLERTFALNHLSYMVLALRLLPNLLATSDDAVASSAGDTVPEPARVINVASRAHRGARLALDDLQSRSGYSGWRAYGRSKLANILFTRSLAARVNPARVTVHAVHPGLVATRFAANNGARGRLQRRIMDWFSVSTAAGADTAAWLLGDGPGARTTGGYWARRQPASLSRLAQDDRLADGLWDASIALTGLTPWEPPRLVDTHTVHR